MAGPEAVAGLTAPGAGIRRAHEGGQREQARLAPAVQEFEAILLTYLLRLARSPWAGRGPAPVGALPGLYRDLLDEELGRALARSGGVGLGRVLLRELLRTEASTPAASRPITIKNPPAGGTP